MNCYIKNSLFVGALVTFGIIFIGEDAFDQILNFNTNLGRGGGYLSGINQEILTGMPNF